MEKVLVNLKVPSIEKEFDVLIPVFLTVGDVIPLLLDALNNMSEAIFVASKKGILCRANPEMVLNNEILIADYGIEHGEVLVLL